MKKYLRTMNATFNQRLFLFAAMGCVGMTGEIFFTAIYDIAMGHAVVIKGETVVPSRLLGYSYLWMFPIYGLGAILFPFLFKLIGHWNVLLRMCVYGAGIIAVEFITGWLLDVTTGQCPWEYKEGWQVMGYIRLDFFPFWAVFGLMVEKLLNFLMSRNTPGTGAAG